MATISTPEPRYATVDEVIARVTKQEAFKRMIGGELSSTNVRNTIAAAIEGAEISINAVLRGEGVTQAEIEGMEDGPGLLKITAIYMALELIYTGDERTTGDNPWFLKSQQSMAQLKLLVRNRITINGKEFTQQKISTSHASDRKKELDPDKLKSQYFK